MLHVAIFGPLVALPMPPASWFSVVRLTRRHNQRPEEGDQMIIAVVDQTDVFID